MRNLKKVSTPFFVVIFLFASAAAWQFSEDCVLTGTVTYFGDSRASVSIKAFIGDQEVASCTSYRGQYRLTIKPDDPETPGVREGYAEGDLVVIEVNGYRAADFSATGGTYVRDLVVSSSDVSNLTTWGKIKALFR